MDLGKDFHIHQNTNDYPPIEPPSSSKWIHHFREQLIFFHFNMSNKQNSNVFRILYTQFVQVLQSIKKCIHENENNQEYKFIIDLFYRLVFYTRDIHHGKGERDMSYLLIMAFYDVYPSLAIYALHEFVRNTYKSTTIESYAMIGSPSIGSWKDIFACCDFLRNYSIHGENHALIDKCVEMAILQLIQDNHTWNHSTSKQNPDYISNVAKWIPREHKKYDWIYNKLVSYWSGYVHSHILRSAKTPESYTKAMLKCKRLFRKQISFLNKQLHTPEIYMSHGNWQSIRRLHMPNKTYLKHFDKLHTTTDIIYENNNGYLHKTRIGSLPSCANMIKHAIRIISNVDSDNKYDLDLSRSHLNSMWKRITSHFLPGEFQFTLPILDVSTTMLQTHTDGFYSAIAIAMMIGSKSSLGPRILAISNYSVWIQWKQTDTFVDIVENIMDSISPIQGSLLHLENSFNLIIQALYGSRSTNRFIENMNVVFISDFSVHINCNEISKLFNINMFDTSPSIICWNVATQNIINMPMDPSGHKHYYHSGNSIYALKSIITSNITVNAFDSIVNLLNNPRYLHASNYLHSLCNS